MTHTQTQTVPPLDGPMVCPTTVGRDAQLASLGRLVAQLAAGGGNTVLIDGEAGIGKTRIVAEARVQALSRGAQVLQGSAFELDQALPYGPVADLFRTFLTGKPALKVLEVLGPAAVAVAHLLPSVAAWLPPHEFNRAAPAAEEGHDRQWLLQGLLLAFDRLVDFHPGPTMVLIEDVHWADETSLELLLHLARLAAVRPVLLVLTVRNEDTSPRLAEFLATLERQRLTVALPLLPLNRPEVEAMLQGILGPGRPLGDALLETLHALTEGNPYFVEEVVRTIIARSDPRVEASTLRVPRTVHDAVLRRVNHLGEPARRAVQMAAVVGRHFDFALLQMLLGLQERELVPLVKELIAAQLVVEDTDDHFAFRHALTRQAVYSDLLGRERRAMHAEVLAALEQLGMTTREVPVEELSYHAHAAGAWSKTLTHAPRAGERALTMHAPRAALEHFHRAVSAAEKLGQPPTPQVHHGRGRAYDTLGQFELARADYDLALESATVVGDKLLAWQVLIDLNLLWAGRDYARAGSYAERCLETARELDDPVSIARSLDRVGNWHLNVGRVRQALADQQEALVLLETVGDRRGVADTLNLLGMTSAFVDPEQSAAYYDRAIPLMREFDDRQALVTDLVVRVLDSGFYWGDTMPPARLDVSLGERDAEEAIRLAGAIDWPAGESFARWELALWYGIRGAYQRAFELAHRGLRLAEEIQHRQWIAGGLCSLGALYVDVLDPERARPMLERALALAHDLGSSVWAPYAAARLAMAYAQQRDFPRAAATFDGELGADTPFESAPERQLWCARAEFLLARGAPDDALVIADKLAAALPAGKVAPRLWIVRGEALAMLQSAGEAERLLTEAIEASRVFDLRSQLWRAHAGLARLLRIRGRRDEADEHVQAARTVVEALAAEIADDAVRDAFVERASRRIPRGLTSARRLNKHAFGGLTGREREVAALIGGGLSNRAIAERLVVSERTIESYVSNILGKLDFNARTQIAAWAATNRVAATLTTRPD